VGYTVADAKEMELVWGVFRPVRHALGGTAFGINQIDFGPDHVGAEHDEVESMQEEIYAVLGGSGVMQIDGEEIELVPGRYVLVHPETKRRPVAGPEGLSMLCIGGIPGDAYPAEPMPDG
jgi:quercetin dioxygenase-like cupin family protein